MNWQHLPEHIQPVIFQLGPFTLRYYGLMYLLVVFTTFLLMLFRVKHEQRFRQYTAEILLTLELYGIAGAIIGGRIGYVLFYNLPYFLERPLEALLPFNFDNGFTFTGFAGLSYHGGLVGVIFAALIFVKLHKINFWNLADLAAPIFPLGYTFGRMGNFFNGELWGRVTESPIGMYFPNAQGAGLRHPSQLYEAFLEGIVLFVILWLIRKKKYPEGSMLGCYIIGYGLARFIVEYFREPDAQLGFVLLHFSMGQLLSGVMIFGGVFLVFYLKNVRRARAKVIP